MNDLIVATRNAGKLREIRELLGEFDLEVRGLDDFPDIPEIIEDGATFAANAAKKADTVVAATGQPCLADDSGLSVRALGGRPGVHSARFAGPGADDHANNLKLLKEMAEVPDGRRQAAFCCVLALRLPGEALQTFSGQVEGEILRAPQGSGGFGYDPLFWLPDFSCTMAELPLETKNRISHRGRALRKLIQSLRLP